jgi:enterochelin esterase-like enzyme
VTKRFALRLAAAFALAVAACPGFAAAVESPRLIAVQRAAGKGDAASAIDRFWRDVARRGTPLVEPVPGRPDEVRVTFLFRGAADGGPVDLAVFGVFNPVPWDRGDPLERLAGTDIWYRSYVLPAAMRAPYLLIGPQPAMAGLARQRTWNVEQPDGSKLAYSLFLDPLNRRTIDDVFFKPPSRDNVFEGPAAPAETWLDKGPLRGSVTTLDVRSEILGDTRRVTIYLPPRRTRSDGPIPMLLLFDGQSYAVPGMVPQMLDGLIAAGRIPPMGAVMLDSVSSDQRQIDLKANERFEDFVVRELVPPLRQRFGFSDDPVRTIVAGASLGGLAAGHIALRHPQMFGNVIAQSPSLWWAPEAVKGEYDWLAGQYAAAPRLPIRFYLDVGSLEDAEDMVEPNRRFATLLRSKGYEVCRSEFLGGHTFLHWRMDLPRALVAVAGAKREGCPAQSR